MDQAHKAWYIHDWVAHRVWNFGQITHRYQLLDPRDIELDRIVFEQDVGAPLGLNEITWQDRIQDMICSAVCEHYREPGHARS